MDENLKETAERLREAAERGFSRPIEHIGLHKFGTDYQLGGAVFTGEGRTFVVMFPDVAEPEPGGPIYPLEFAQVDDWEAFLRQLDLQEVEILREVEGKWTKAILRKSQRQIEQGVQWEVFRRDEYRCRYCANADVPLTVDHLVLWEHNGPSIAANLVTACRKCNKTRGSTPYEHWLQHKYYLRVSQNLDPIVRHANKSLVDTLDDIPRTKNKRSR